MNRRKFIVLAGGGVIAAAGTAATGFALTRTPTKALAPWKEAGSLYTEPRKRALSYAILAPNPHNRQPWLVDLSQDGKAVLYADTSRLLEHTDPFSRQITIGLGCFLEILRMAAAEDGYRTSLDPFPDGFDNQQLDARPVAVVSFAKDPAVEKDPLFAHVLDRRSMKEDYDTARPVPESALKDLEHAAGGGVAVATTNDPKRVAQMRQFTQHAMAIEIDTPRTYKESVDLFRIGKAEIEANPDGLDFSGPKFESLAALGLFSREVALDRNSSAFQQGIEAVMAPMRTAMAYVWLVTPANTRMDQLNAGRDWVRINLAATRAGIGIHPMSQALQEYPEMKAEYARVHERLAAAGGTVQMLGRLGYADSVPPSPRWQLDTKIVKDGSLG